MNLTTAPMSGINLIPLFLHELTCRFFLTVHRRISWKGATVAARFSFFTSGPSLLIGYRNLFLLFYFFCMILGYGTEGVAMTLARALFIDMSIHLSQRNIMDLTNRRRYKKRNKQGKYGVGG